MKRCDLCKFWRPKKDVGYCEKLYIDEIDWDDQCSLYASEEKELSTLDFLRKFSREMEKSSKKEV